MKALSLGLRADSKKDQSALLAAAIRRAGRAGAALVLPAGRILARDLEISGPVRLLGEAGATLAAAPGARFALFARGGPVELQGLRLEGAGARGGGEEDAILRLADCPDVRIHDCVFRSGPANALFLRRCSGEIARCDFSGHGRAGIFSLDGAGLRVLKNAIRRCGANGVMIWQSAKRFDGARVEGNVIAHIRADRGGDGPYGNGVNVFRAGGVEISGNAVRHCAWSAIRDNSGDDCRIISNHCADLGEVAIFVEFAFRRATVSGNRVSGASAGICVTNMDVGGGGAVVRGNIIRDIAPRMASEDVLGYGVWAEDETEIAGNLVEGAVFGLWLGWGRYLRDVTARGNTLRRCRTGIVISFTPGAGRATVAGNVIEGYEAAAIAGYDHDRPVSGDLLAPGAMVPARVILRGNVASR